MYLTRLIINGFFTGIYFTTNGTDADGEIAIYGFLNYQTNLSVAVGVCFALVFFAIPLVFLSFWAQFRLRLWLWRKYDTHENGLPDADVNSLTDSTTALAAHGGPTEFNSIKF